MVWELGTIIRTGSTSVLGTSHASEARAGPTDTHDSAPDLQFFGAKQPCLADFTHFTTFHYISPHFTSFHVISCHFTGRRSPLNPTGFTRNACDDRVPNPERCALGVVSWSVGRVRLSASLLFRSAGPSYPRAWVGVRLYIGNGHPPITSIASPRSGLDQETIPHAPPARYDGRRGATQ